MSSNRIGDETEVAALHRLISDGYDVSIPFGDNQKYDLIADDGDSLYRLQCKTVWRTTAGTIRFNTHSQTTRDGEYHEQTYEGGVDALFVRYPAIGTCYLVLEEAVTTQKMALRFESKIDHPSINWAEDFRFEGEMGILD